MKLDLFAIRLGRVPQHRLHLRIERLSAFIMTTPTHYDPSSASEEPLPAVDCPIEPIIPEIVFFAPRTRRGHGPGVIQLLPPNLPQDAQRLGPVPLDPPSSVKLAEEGFAVVAGCVNDGEYPLDVRKLVKVGLETLEKRDEVDGKERFAVLAYTQELLDQLLPLVSLHPKIACVIAFDGSSATSPVPLLSHIASSDPSPGKTTREGITTTHTYAGVQPHFWDVSAAVYTPGPSALSHTRTLVFLRTHLPGLDFDREAIWEEHCRYEFEERSVAKTMGTMVEEPYVNHIPTMTGGIGREALTAFYRDHFIFKNPRDTSLELISRTVGPDRVIDEFVTHLTHDTAVDWLLPGVPPTGRRLAVPMVAVVLIRGDRLAHEHIWWDQAGALRQTGLLPERVSLPGTDGETIRLPVAGVEASRLAVDEMAGGGNAMLGDMWAKGGT